MSSLAFLELVDDPELRQEIRAVLARLEAISEVGAATVGRSSRSSEAPTGPPGFLGLSRNECPPEDRSLFDHFRWRFDREARRGRERKQLWFLLWEAQKALETRTVSPGLDNARTALVLTRADEDALVRLILDAYEGDHSYRVHLDLNLPQGWIEKVREDNGHDPEHGYRRPSWRELEEEGKRTWVARALQGRTQAEAARFLGVSRRTVATYSPAES